jgi:hypothetical protein
MNHIDPKVRYQLDVAVHNARAIAKRHLAHLEALNTDQWPLEERVRHLQEISTTRTVDEQLTFILWDYLQDDPKGTNR